MSCGRGAGALRARRADGGMRQGRAYRISVDGYGDYVYCWGEWLWIACRILTCRAAKESKPSERHRGACRACNIKRSKRVRRILLRRASRESEPSERHRGADCALQHKKPKAYMLYTAAPNGHEARTAFFLAKLSYRAFPVLPCRTATKRVPRPSVQSARRTYSLTNASKCKCAA